MWFFNSLREPEPEARSASTNILATSGCSEFTDYRMERGTRASQDGFVVSEVKSASTNIAASSASSESIHRRLASENRITKVLEEGFVITEEGAVTWSEKHPHHPRSWSLARKLYDTGIMFALELFTTLISNTGSLSALAAHEQLYVSQSLAIFLFSTVYLIGQAVGTAVLPPYTESYGRKPTYIVSAFVFCIATAIVGASGHATGIIIGRFISGFASAVPSIVLAGGLEDMWSVKARIWAVDFWVLSSLIGVSFAPSFANGIASVGLGWQWIYYVAAIISAVLCVGVCFIRESRPKIVFLRYVKSLGTTHRALVLDSGNKDIMPLSEFIGTALWKPLYLLYTEPVIAGITVLMSSTYASAYLLTEALPKIYAGYGFSPVQSGLVYLGVSIGAALGLLVRLWDIRVIRVRESKGQEVIPEDKLLGFFIAAPVQAIAFWWFAWTIPPHGEFMSPSVSILAIIPTGFAINEFEHVLTGYLIDTYTSAAGSACAFPGVLRSILSAVFPLLGEKMFSSMSPNIAASLIAIVATLYIGFAVAFFFYGQQIREASPWVKAQKTQEGLLIREKKWGT